MKQASVQEVREQKISRANAFIIIVMCYHPRGIKAQWRDDFRNILAPDRELFKEWKAFEKTKGHDQAFELSHYEDRFSLSPLAMNLLKVYSQWSHEKDVYLVCQCEVGQRCHREMLLLVAKKKYDAAVGEIFLSYARFEARIPSLLDKLWNK